MSNITNDENRKLIPAYTLETIEKHPVNPYREFTYYCLRTLFPSIASELHMSLKDFYAAFTKSKDAAFELLNLAVGKVSDNITLSISAENGNKDVIFLPCDVNRDGTLIGHLNFYTSKSANASNQNVNVAAELILDEFDGFDFLELPRRDNVFIFCKDDQHADVLDLICAFLKGTGEFLEFVRSYKAKLLVTKNIDMFAKKFVDPYVLNTCVQYKTDEFMIAVLCGDKILRHTYPYDNYLNSIREFGDAIQKQYGNKFKDIKDASINADKSNQ